jgi:hypothetical protein
VRAGQGTGGGQKPVSATFLFINDKTLIHIPIG